MSDQTFGRDARRAWDEMHINVETDPVMQARSAREFGDKIKQSFINTFHKLAAEAERDEIARAATITRLITILRDETQSAAVHAACVSIVGER